MLAIDLVQLLLVLALSTILHIDMLSSLVEPNLIMPDPSVNLSHECKAKSNLGNEKGEKGR